jgi:hypothetical protein
VAAKYILAALSVLFLILAFTQMARGGGAAHPQSRTWLLVGIIFGIVSAWLFSRG